MYDAQRDYLHSLKYKFVVTKYRKGWRLWKVDTRFLKKHYTRLRHMRFNYQDHSEGWIDLYVRK